jgi:DNA polymerase-3 subunit delta'
MVKWVAQFAELGRENQKQLILYGLHFLREYTMLKLTGKENLRLTASEIKTAQNLSKVIEFDQIEDITQLLSDAHYFIERNANPKVLMLDASIQMNHILKRKSREKRFSGVKY